MTTFLESEWFWVSTLSVLVVPRKETPTHESRPAGIQAILETLHWEVSGTGVKPENSLCEQAWLLQES